MEVKFHIMIDKLKTGVWEKATTVDWQKDDGQYLTLKILNGNMKLLFHENYDKVTEWTLGTNDSLNIKFMELKNV